MIYIVSSFLPTYFKLKKNNDYVIGLGTKENTSISTISSSDYIVQTHEYASMVFGQSNIIRLHVRGWVRHTFFEKFEIAITHSFFKLGGRNFAR